MAKYALYAGLGGGFGGASFEGVYDFEDEEEAMDAARQLAEEEYESYAGLYGIMDWGDCEQDCRDSGWITEDMTEDEIGEMVDSRYNEEMESWLSYHIREATPEECETDEESEEE